MVLLLAFFLLFSVCAALPASCCDEMLSPLRVVVLWIVAVVVAVCVQMHPESVSLMTHDTMKKTKKKTKKKKEKRRRKKNKKKKRKKTKQQQQQQQKSRKKKKKRSSSSNRRRRRRTSLVQPVFKKCCF